MKCKQLVLTLTLLTLAAAGAFAQQVPTNGLVANWTMDGTGPVVTDHSGTGNHGNLSGEANLVGDPDMGTAIEMYGPTGSIIVPYSPTLEPAVGTIQVWVRFAQLTNATLFVKGTYRQLRSGVDGGIDVYGMRVDGKGTATTYIANDANGYPWTWLSVPSKKLAINEWHLITMRWNGAAFSMFIDDKLLSSIAYDPIPEVGLSYYGVSPFLVTPSTTDPAYHFIGRIARIRVYNRALSENEVQDTFLAEAPAQQGGKGTIAPKLGTARAAKR